MLTGIELTGKLKAKIDSADDEDLLLQLLRLLDIESKTDELYFLSEAEEIAVKEGIAQLDQGVFLSNEEANSQADQCLNK